MHVTRLEPLDNLACSVPQESVGRLEFWEDVSLEEGLHHRCELFLRSTVSVRERGGRKGEGTNCLGSDCGKTGQHAKCSILLSRGRLSGVPASTSQRPSSQLGEGTHLETTVWIRLRRGMRVVDFLVSTSAVTNVKDVAQGLEYESSMKSVTFVSRAPC